MLLALGYFWIVFLPIGKYVHLTGGTRTAVLALALFGPMLIGVPVALSLGLMATLYVALVGDISFMTAALQTYNGITIYTLLAIPLLILSGKLMHAAGIAKLLVNFAQVSGWAYPRRIGRFQCRCELHFRRHLRFGGVRYGRHRLADDPADEAARLPRRFCAALQAAAGTLGMTAPLSITVLLYAAAASTSVGRLAAATIGRPCLLVLSFIALVVWHAKRHNYPREHVPRELIVPHTLRAIPGLFALIWSWSASSAASSRPPRSARYF